MINNDCFKASISGVHRIQIRLFWQVLSTNHNQPVTSGVSYHVTCVPFINSILKFRTWRKYCTTTILGNPEATFPYVKNAISSALASLSCSNAALIEHPRRWNEMRNPVPSIMRPVPLKLWSHAPQTLQIVGGAFAKTDVWIVPRSYGVSSSSNAAFKSVVSLMKSWLFCVPESYSNVLPPIWSSLV